MKPAPPPPDRSSGNDLDSLYRARPKDRLLRITLVALALLAVYAWTSGEIAVRDLFQARRAENLQRFVSEDLLPFPLREQGFSLSGLAAWIWDLTADRGLSGLLTTLAMSVLAIVLAGTMGILLAPLAARNLAHPRPFLPAAHASTFRASLPWRVLTTVVRSLFLVLRAIPEYLWAFLLLAIFGPGAWPAVIALALHNGGILGRLNAETVENLPPAPERSLVGIGATRHQLYLHAIVPHAFNRFLLYFFYRFETCVREATVLGMLGIASLGYWIQDARAKLYYDEMLFFVALGTVLILGSDLVSGRIRAHLRAV